MIQIIGNSIRKKTHPCHHRTRFRCKWCQLVLPTLMRGSQWVPSPSTLDEQANLRLKPSSSFQFAVLEFVRRLNDNRNEGPAFIAIHVSWGRLSRRVPTNKSFDCSHITGVQTISMKFMVSAKLLEIVIKKVGLHLAATTTIYDYIRKIEKFALTSKPYFHGEKPNQTNHISNCR